ncbi:SPOR domain-containing protein [Campylobacter sp. MIT 97-5078]|uniref:SPOR domain-containing protein n=1 Tax=Campylobacter sp. MIT 97-5078 TaxID=1548153 RepID=UPI000512DE54|nr:SPOR domain-containing protein [Campylobacter sp. MIT 97-5078]KGI56725.1 hypothetical protein LR59_05770 [Campylobacter sp. MIT 97-5078]KGI57196.1 hypothetical protein LR59_00140 [Campylobacter sp. MIT 97-5078]TQR27581.1 SPOR domain-containing protein [Campylobacter sp. MIT 97-5078]
MENKNSFDDLILDKNNKSEKIKKILLRVIALVILFLIVMIVMKLINNDESTNQAQNSQSIFPSEPSSEQNPNTFDQIPISSSTIEDDQFQALRDRMQGLEQNESADNEANQSFAMPPLEEPRAEIPTTLPQEPTQTTAKPSAEEKKPTPPSKTQSNTTATTKPKTEPKPVATDPKDLFDDVKTTTNDDKLGAGTYIQIFSVSKFDPKSKELALIKQNGYEYKLYKTKVNNNDVTRVLIGPFSKDELSAELSKIREKIKKDAFTFQVK